MLSWMEKRVEIAGHSWDESALRRAWRMSGMVMKLVTPVAGCIASGFLKWNLFRSTGSRSVIDEIVPTLLTSVSGGALFTAIVFSVDVAIACKRQRDEAREAWFGFSEDLASKAIDRFRALIVNRTNGITILSQIKNAMLGQGLSNRNWSDFPDNVNTSMGWSTGDIGGQIVREQLVESQIVEIVTRVHGAMSHQTDYYVFNEHGRTMCRYLESDNPDVNGLSRVKKDSGQSGPGEGAKTADDA